MICFQTYIFVILNTAEDFFRIPFTLLWFAFKLISLSYWIQLTETVEDGKGVVICFQTYIFVILNTALPRLIDVKIGCDLLSNLYLCHIEYSRRCGSQRHGRSCDLLSNLYLCHIEYSTEDVCCRVCSVVICFQTYIFVILNTAISLWRCGSVMLWFAFKLISLSYWIQPPEPNM